MTGIIMITRKSRMAKCSKTSLSATYTAPRCTAQDALIFQKTNGKLPNQPSNVFESDYLYFSLQDTERLKNEETVRNTEFEKNNGEFCNQYLDDMKVREKAVKKKQDSAESYRLKGAYPCISVSLYLFTLSYLTLPYLTLLSYLTILPYLSCLAFPTASS